MASYTVLIVEDEEPLRNNLARVVAGRGYRVATASNGVEACRVLQEDVIDIVLSDLRMPHLDGFGLLKWMRSHAYLQPVIVISGNGMIESAIAALRLDAYDYLIKPFELEDITAALRRAETSVLAQRASMGLTQRNRELAALTTISAAGSSSLDLNHMLQETIPVTMDVLRVGGAVVYLSNGVDEFYLDSSYGELHDVPAWLPTTLRMAYSPPPEIGALRVAATFTLMYSEQPLRCETEILAALFPLQAQGQLCGLVLLTHPSEGTILPEQRDLLLSIGNIIGVGVANARMYGAVYTSAVFLEEQVALRTHELQRSRDLLRTTFDGIPNGLVLLDHTGTILAANRACANLLRHPLRNLVGAIYNRMWPVAHIESMEEMFNQCLVSGTSIYRRVRIEHSGRSPIVLDCYLFPVQSDVPGELMQVIEYLDNVTDRLALEQVVAQTEQLAALGKLAATVAHEVNTPLLAIRGCVSLATDAPDAATRNEYLSLAQGELDRAASIIRGLLDFYRPAGREHIRANLNALTTQVLQLLHAECLHKEISVVQDLDAQLPAVDGSPDQLKQVLLNLVLNAIESMEAGGRLSMQTFSTPLVEDIPGERYAVVQVCDTGMGIPTEILDRLFDAFVTTKSNGNGLGLAVCRTIVCDHAGIIEAMNLPEGGACFTVKLPISLALIA